MKHQRLQRISGLLAFALFLGTLTQSFAQGQRRGIYGDWNITTQFGENPFQSILAFSRNAEGNLTGSWITFFGSTELKDLSFENNQLRFTQTFRGRNGESTSEFRGSTEDGKLTGTLTSDRGESKVTGERAPRTPRAAGSWAMKIKAGEREFTGTLNIKSDSSGNLTGDWTSQRGVAKVHDIVSNRRELAFKRTIKTQDNEWESSFEGTIQGNTLTGISKSQRGDAETTGERIGGAAIGTWNLVVESNQGTRNQRLRVNSDLSGLYGSTAIDKIKLEDNQISFTTSVEFGDREFNWDFHGQIDGGSLSGELTTTQGSRKVTGKKAALSLRRSR